MTGSPIARVYVAACRTDFHLTKLCIASIRYWYPDIPITLISDFDKGDFDPGPLRRDWKIDLFATDTNRFGWGYSKLEPLFLPRRERYVMLDSDLVLLGPVLDLLERNPADFVVHDNAYTETDIELGHFIPAPLANFDPSFPLPRFVFNTGHYLGTSGLLQRSDFDSVLDWTSPRTPRHPGIFKCGEQGLLNYVIFKAEAEGRLTLGCEQFYLWRAHDTSAVTVDQIATRKSLPQILHWNGKKAARIKDMERPDILGFYEKFYRGRSSWRSRWHDWKESQPRARWMAWRKQTTWRALQWLLGTPFAAGGSAWDLRQDNLSNFHHPETHDGVEWRWAQPEAAITLRVLPGRYRVIIETGSPTPMADLAQRKLRFFLDDRALPGGRLTYTSNGVVFNLEPADFAAGERHQLLWTMDCLAVPAIEKRRLGMPILSLRLHRLKWWRLEATTATETAR